MEKALEDARWGGGGEKEGERGRCSRTLPCPAAEVDGLAGWVERKQRGSLHPLGEGNAINSQIGLR